MPSPSYITTAQLAARTAGGRDYIRTKGNVIKGLALVPRLNPNLPDVVEFGSGPRVQKRAESFLDSREAVPTYVKRHTNQWEYLGKYRATAIRRDQETIRRYGTSRPTGTVAGVLFLESESEPNIQVSGGGFADPQTRMEIEAAAIDFATRTLETRGFTVHDHQRENQGYDLFAVSRHDQLSIEVKGTASPEPRFFLTRNERRCSEERPGWRLFVVCNARSNPVLHEYTADEVYRTFSLAPLVWQCTLRHP